jgi:hypothetical protein
MILKWNISKEDHDLIAQIAERAKEFARKQGVDYSWRDALMDLTAAHANGSPLDLAGLLAAKPMDFSHDVFGIANHLDHETGKLTRGGVFTPRYRKQAVS